MKAFRILGRNIRDSFKSVFRNFSLSLASISCITITLLIVSISMILSYNIENIATLIKKDFSIVVFVDNDATEEEVKYIETEGLTLPNYLISGIYHYTFRLDLNYNYVLINKSYEEKY